MNCCFSCKWWRPQNNPGATIGECHRFPPNGRGELDAWPLTSAIEDCGEHEDDDDRQPPPVRRDTQERPTWRKEHGQ